MLRRQLGYKIAWYGSRLVVADRWYPSSKTCSRCKALKAKPSLAERIYPCDSCGPLADRDANAAANLAFLVESVTSIGTASGAGTGQELLLASARGKERFLGLPRRSSMNWEDGTGFKLDKTATWQQVAPKPDLVGGDRRDRFRNGRGSRLCHLALMHACFEAGFQDAKRTSSRC